MLIILLFQALCTNAMFILYQVVKWSVAEIDIVHCKQEQVLHCIADIESFACSETNVSSLNRIPVQYTFCNTTFQCELSLGESGVSCDSFYSNP